MKYPPRHKTTGRGPVSHMNKYLQCVLSFLLSLSGPSTPQHSLPAHSPFSVPFFLISPPLCSFPSFPKTSVPFTVPSIPFSSWKQARGYGERRKFVQRSKGSTSARRILLYGAISVQNNQFISETANALVEIRDNDNVQPLYMRHGKAVASVNIGPSK